MPEATSQTRAADPNAGGNVPEYSVGEISGAVKRLLEGAFGRVRVRGEITEFKRYPSGHLYFSLKDENGKISGVVWKGGVSRLGLQPENGLEVIATGRITAYGERSSYQLVVERMEYAGEGALLARIERLRLKLQAEGLFDPDRKRPIPFLPRLIGLVTSPQGAVLHDIRTTVARRFPRSLLLWPVPVQGEGAAARIAAAIAGFDRHSGPGGTLPRPDVLIVARGGGSLEDLAAFSDEAVLRAVAACSIPVISAVGHETDTTLVDFVSDRRAPTPTAAAEMAVPVRADLLADLAHRAARLANAANRLADARRTRLDRAAAALPDLPDLLGAARQRLDDRLHRLAVSYPVQFERRRAGLADGEHRLHRALPALAARRRASLLAVERALPDPRRLLSGHGAALTVAAAALRRALPLLLERRRGAFAAAVLRLGDGSRLTVPPRHALSGIALRLRPALSGVSHRAMTESATRRTALSALAGRLRPALAGVMHREAALAAARRTRLSVLSARLESVSPQAVLERGYVLVQDRDGRPVTRAAALRAGAALSLRFGDGTAAVRVEPASSQGRLDL